jgi:hypothetical protein
MNPIRLAAFTMTSCLGPGLDAARAAIRTNATGLTRCRFETVTLDTFVGEIAGVDAQELPPALARFDCRNNRAAELGLAQDGFMEAVAAAARRYGPARIGVFMGTSTAGILQTELAYRRRGASGELPPDFNYRTTHNTFSIAEYVRARLGSRGPVRGDLHRVLVERQGVRLRRAPDRGGRDRCRRGRRRRHALPHDALRLQLAGAALERAVPSLRRRPRRDLHRRGRGLLPARARQRR